MKDLLDTLRGWVQTSTAPRRAAYRILKAPWLNRNPIYRRAYRKRIKRVIRRYSDFPRTVSLETSAFCNARCIMCTYPIMRRTKGLMSWSLFADAVDECARRDWGAIVDSIVVRQPQDWIGGIELEPEVYTPHRGRRRRFWPPCIYPFTQLNVYWDGTVPVCCLDYEAEGRVGRFGEQSLTRIWQNQAINHYRKRHLAQDRRLPPPCSRCSYFSVWW